MKKLLLCICLLPSFSSFAAQTDLEAAKINFCNSVFVNAMSGEELQKLMDLGFNHSDEAEGREAVDSAITALNNFAKECKASL